MSKLSATVHAEIAEACAEAMRLWDAVRCASSNEAWRERSVPDRMGFFQERGYSAFITRHCIPVRYMVMGEFRVDIFGRWLRRVAQLGYASRDEWCRRQADYVKMLWRAYNPRSMSAESQAQWQHAYETMRDEMSAFEGDHARAKTLTDARQAEFDRAGRDTLHETLATPGPRRDRVMAAMRRNASSSSGPVVAEPVAAVKTPPVGAS